MYIVRGLIKKIQLMELSNFALNFVTNFRDVNAGRILI